MISIYRALLSISNAGAACITGAARSTQADHKLPLVEACETNVVAIEAFAKSLISSEHRLLLPVNAPQAWAHPGALPPVRR